MIKRLVIIGIAAAIAVFLAMPAIALNDKKADADDMVSIRVSAYVPAYRDWSGSDITITVERGDAALPSYWSYIGEYWGGFVNPGTTIPDYPFLSVLVQKAGEPETRQTWTEPYTYGYTLVWDGTYAVVDGDTLFIQAQVYWSQSSGAYESLYYEVS